MMITVRYFGGTAAAAGVTTEQIDVPAGATIDALTSQLGSSHESLKKALQVSSFLINEEPAEPIAVIPAEAIVDVMPPYAGG